MADKTVSKHLLNLEKQFAAADPVLQRATKTFHELDQLEFDMGLIENDDTVARRATWWPIISTLGGYSSSKSEFISRYFGVSLHASRHKFTVHQYTPQNNPATLPATALDADHRLPFYQISREIELAIKGEGSKINAYLELVTVNSDKLKGKLVIDPPVLSATTESPVNPILRKRVIDMSDLVLVFTDLFESDPQLNSDSVAHIVAQQDSNKFVYVIDHSEISLDPLKTNEIIGSWQRRLAELGIHTGQFAVLSDAGDTSVIDQRITNIFNDRTYRILQSLEKSIRDVDDIIIMEVERAINIWKDRADASILIILGFIATMLVFAEIAVGVLELFLDPFIGPAIIIGIIAIVVPLHFVISKVHAKFIINELNDRQKQLNLTEDLAGLFEKSLTFWRILLPIKTSIAKNKKTKSRLSGLIEQTKSLVQSLNDQYSHYRHDSYGTTVAMTQDVDNDQLF